MKSCFSGNVTNPTPRLFRGVEIQQAGRCVEIASREAAWAEVNPSHLGTNPKAPEKGVNEHKHKLRGNRRGNPEEFS